MKPYLFPVAIAYILIAAAVSGNVAHSAGLKRMRAPHTPGRHAKVTADRRAASDQHMQAGLSQLQSAQSALQSSNTSGAVSSLQSAAAEMKQASPIYHGWREKAIGQTQRAVRELGGKKAAKGAAVPQLIANAIADAQSALSRSAPPAKGH